MILIPLLLFGLGIFLLIKSSGILVSSASRIARILGVSDFVIGLTLVAIGTSLPEFASSVISSLKGVNQIAIGNIVGANITNLTFIIGIAASTTMLKADENIYRRDGIFMLGVSVFLLLLSVYGEINFIAGLFMILVYIAYLSYTIQVKYSPEYKAEIKDFIVYFIKLKYLPRINQIPKSLSIKSLKLPSREIAKDLLFSALSVLGIVISADLVTGNAIKIASFLGVPEGIIAVTLISVGTTIPELSVTLSALKQGYNELLIGNVVGSNITNILLILGTSSLIMPIQIGDFKILFTVCIMTIFTFIFLRFIRSGWSISRYEGISLLVLYANFIYWIVILTSSIVIR